MSNFKYKNLFLVIGMLLMTIVLWQLLYNVMIEVLHIWKPYMFASPLMVLNTTKRLIETNVLQNSILSSLTRLFKGFSLSLLIGFIIGLGMTRFKFLGSYVKGVVSAFQTLPSICWLPFAILWFGLSESAIIFMISIGSMFSIAISVYSGFNTIPPIYIKAGWSLGAIRWKKYLFVIFPASLPVLISGMKQSWSFAWRALIAGEMIFSTVGLGYVLTIGRDLGDISQVMTIMLIILSFGIFFEKVVFGSLETYIQKIWGYDSNTN